MRVINYSAGPSSFDKQAWHDAFQYTDCGPGARDDDLPGQGPVSHSTKVECTPDTLDRWQREIANVGRAAAPIAREAARRGIMIVQAAGNDGEDFPGLDTASRNEFAWVSRHWDDYDVGEAGLENPVLEVQAVKDDDTPRSDSTLGADVAAPGDKVLSTVTGGGYAEMGGSSMAAPQVTALIGMLLADQPTLSIAELRRRVLEWGKARTGAKPLDFSYEMVDRQNRDDNGDAIVDPVTGKDQVETTGYKVDLDACDTTLPSGRTVGTYTWRAKGEVIGDGPDCRLRWRAMDEGSFPVAADRHRLGRRDRERDEDRQGRRPADRLRGRLDRLRRGQPRRPASAVPEVAVRAVRPHRVRRPGPGRAHPRGRRRQVVGHLPAPRLLRRAHDRRPRPRRQAGGGRPRRRRPAHALRGHRPEGQELRDVPQPLGRHLREAPARARQGARRQPHRRTR